MMLFFIKLFAFIIAVLMNIFIIPVIVVIDMLAVPIDIVKYTIMIYKEAIKSVCRYKEEVCDEKQKRIH